jgi:hypothetical protein
MVLGLPRGTAILDSSDLVSLSTRRFARTSTCAHQRRNSATAVCRRSFFLLEHSDSTMKFTLAVTALTAATSAAFMPRSMSARGNSLHMSAVEEATYTFAKSEEIFAEAQEVRFCISCGIGCPT